MYREENDQVILTMSREDYEIVLMALGAFTAIDTEPGRTAHMLMVLNRLNEGSPNYTPYETEKRGPIS